MSTIADSLWGSKARISYLFFATVILLFSFLGGREIWTQEHRWADIVAGMFFRNDFLHPYLGGVDYYDKPLLSYWLIVLLVKINHALTLWTLRLPSALAGVLTIWSVYKLGSKLQGKQLGLLSGWLLLTTFYFVFWSRTSSADMLNLAGTMFAVSWYYDKRDNAGIFDYAVFFSILALTSLCKGLVGAIVPMIAVFVDIGLQKSWKQHLRPALFLAVVPAAVIYVIPFMASSFFGGSSYEQNGLYLVYRENILRYFKPFDHQGPIYTYLIYLPIYLLPWAFFFFPALLSVKSRWKTMSPNLKWNAWTLLALFIFFTLSGSRRSYYVLPMVPFAILFIADWILSGTSALAKKKMWSAAVIVISFILLFAIQDLFPQWYYSRYGTGKFAQSLQLEVNKIKPWETWNIVGLDADSKFNFYLQLSPTTVMYHIKGNVRHHHYTEAQLMDAWPILKDKPQNTIYLSRKRYAPLLKNMLPDHREFVMNYSRLPFARNHDVEVPVAFIPVSAGMP